MEKDTKILLDCGNGITRQLNMEEGLENLTIIISHLHKDHYGDLLSLAYTSYVYHNLGLLNNKIKVYLPKPNYKQEESTYFNLSNEKVTRLLESTINDYNFLTNLESEQFLEFETYDKNTKIKLNDLELTFARNPHQINAYSTKVTTNSNSIVYSSDTGYQENILEEFAKNADLLICESTYLKEHHRSVDNHLYAQEAGLIAEKAQPKKLLLTHFWPNIAKEKYLYEAQEIFPLVEAAEEGKF